MPWNPFACDFGWIPKARGAVAMRFQNKVPMINLYPTQGWKLWTLSPTNLIVVSFHHLEKFDDVLPAPNVKWTCPFSLSTLNDIAGGPSDPRDKRLLSTHEKFWTDSSWSISKHFEICVVLTRLILPEVEKEERFEIFEQILKVFPPFLLKFA